MRRIKNTLRKHFPGTRFTQVPGWGIKGSVRRGVAAVSLVCAVSIFSGPALFAEFAVSAEPLAVQSQKSPEAATEGKSQEKADASSSTSTSSPASAPSTPGAAEEMTRAAERAAEQQLQELDRKQRALDERLAATRVELEELDRQAEAVAEERAAAVEEEEERLSRARRETSERREEEKDSREGDGELFHYEDGNDGDGDDGDWKHRTLGPRLGIGTTQKVRSSEAVEGVVSIFGGAKVEGDVDGDVTTLGGAAKVNGHVTGSVTAIGGNVELGPRAVIEGDVTSVGGRIVMDERARVEGELNDGGSWDIGEFHDFDLFGRGSRVRSFIGWHDWIEFFWALLFTGFLVLLTTMVFLVFRRPVERVRDTVFDVPLKAFLTGFLVLVLSIPVAVAVMIVLGISIIGIPILIILILLLPFVLIGLCLALLYGYSAVALAVGSILRSQLRLGLGSSLLMLALGVVALRALGLCGDLLDAIGLPGFLTLLFGSSALLVQLTALSVGLGAVILSRFGLQGRAPAASLPPSDLPPVPEFDADYSHTDGDGGREDDDSAPWMDSSSEDTSDDR